MNTINWSDFEKIDLRAGTVLEADFLPAALKPAIRMRIDFGGTLGQKSSSAQLTDLYTPEDLIGRQVIAVVNFPPKRIAGFISECLVLGIYAPEGVVLLHPEQPVPNGSRIG